MAMAPSKHTKWTQRNRCIVTHVCSASGVNLWHGAQRGRRTWKASWTALASGGSRARCLSYSAVMTSDQLAAGDSSSLPAPHRLLRSQGSFGCRFSSKIAGLDSSASGPSFCQIFQHCWDGRLEDHASGYK